MINPIEIILSARKRIADLAVFRILLHAALPLAAMVAISSSTNFLNRLAFDYFGYFLDGAAVRLFQISLFSIAAVVVLTTAGFGWRAWLSASDFMRAAEQIDRCINGHQEVVTLAGLSEPARSEADTRSPLFPMLWQHVSASLADFDPSSRFELELRKPLIRSLMLTVVIVIGSGAIAFALMIPAGPTRIVSRRLQLLANPVGSAPGLAQQQLAAAARDVANDLNNPKLPPEQKIAELRSIEQELHKFEAQNSGSRAGRGSSAGNGAGEGSGQGSGPGNGHGDSQSGAGVGKSGNGNRQMIELRNEIAKAQTTLQQEADSRTKTATARSHSAKDIQPARKPGSNPNQQGGQNSANGSGQVPEPQNVASAKMPLGNTARARAAEQGSMGDTHLGEFPKRGNYQRFYKLGDRGAAKNVRDARYVTFQLPTEIESAGTGTMVADNTRPRATTPYTNAPLKPQRLTASPDEQQLVPPRYRELIR